MDQNPVEEIWLTPEEAAAELKVSKGTLLYWRQTEQGPAYRKLGDGRTAPIRYPKHLLEAWKRSRPLPRGSHIDQVAC